MDSNIELRSSAFREGGAFPAQFSCDGDDTSPPLEWSGVPARAQSLALVMLDPDAPRGTFTHWLLWDLPASSQGLPAGVAPAAHPPSGGTQGTNGFHRLGYSGPCPPPGPAHHYVFTLYALDAKLELEAGANRAAWEAAAHGHVLASAHLTVTFARPE